MGLNGCHTNKLIAAKQPICNVGLAVSRLLLCLNNILILKCYNV